VLWLDVKLPIRCGLRIWDADGGEFDLYRSTDIAATVIRYQPQKPFKPQPTDGMYLSSPSCLAFPPAPQNLRNNLSSGTQTHK